MSHSWLDLKVQAYVGLSSFWINCTICANISICTHAEARNIYIPCHKNFTLMPYFGYVMRRRKECSTFDHRPLWWAIGVCRQIYVISYCIAVKVMQGLCLHFNTLKRLADIFANAVTNYFETTPCIAVIFDNH